MDAMMLTCPQNGSSPPTTHESSPLKSNLKTNGGGQVDYKKVRPRSLLHILH